MEDQRLFTIMATPVEVPAVVDRRRWPVHVTLVGNFHADNSQSDAVAASVAAIGGDTFAFEVALGPADQFGATHSIPVLIAEHPTFHRLHESLAARLMRLPGFGAVEPAFWGSGYRPHATLGVAVNATEGSVVEIDWVSLFTLEGHTGRRLSTIHLKKTW